ncbi:MAG: carbohydrate ABC transporter permease [Desulfobacterales bacterium]|jgi:ABC-type glycerol-3-phosphate transport system permease component|nr:MAG: carbohydrate ABC transporter permease [Desulfobacterales bacterium]
MIKRHLEKKLSGRIGLHLFLGITSFLTVSPFIWVVFTSFKPSNEIVTETPRLLPAVWTLENYLKLPKVAPFMRFFLNSIIISGVSTFCIALGSAACGYVFAKYRFRGKDFLFGLVIATILIPLQTYIVPLYLLTWKLGWINTYQGMIFPLIIMSSGIFFLRQNIMSIPDTLIDAARVDGATEWRVFFSIILPLSVSAIAAISIVNWVYTWSLFIWPLIVANSTEMFTMELGLMYFQREFAVDYGGIMAACVITLLPVLAVFLIFRTRIIEGVAFTGIKR